MAVKYFNFISLQEAVGMLKGEIPLKPNSCVVTFDDGHLNNVVYALPILRKYRIPVVFYPSTKALDSGSPYWFDRLDFAVQQPGLNNLRVRVGNSEIRIEQTSRRRLEYSLSRITQCLKKQNQPDSAFQREVTELCNIFETQAGRSIYDICQGDFWSVPMSWDDIVECGKMADVTIGSHTVSHVRLPFVDDDLLRTELVDSKRMLEERTGKPCVHFCYPNGDWDERSAQAVREAGYQSAVTTDVGCNEVGADLYKLKRYTFPVTGSALRGVFAITGVLHFLTRRKSIFS